MKVLIADDDRATRHLLAHAVRGWGFEVEEASNGHEALEVFRAAERPMLAILDWEMPGLDGPEVCQRIRQISDGSYRYVIMLSVRDSQGDLMHGFEAGVDDYLRKPVDVNELRLRLQAGQRVLDLQERLLEVQEKLRYEAAHDGLTGLLTHNRVLEGLARETSRLARQNGWLTLLVGDLDHFKQVNDTFGHQIGDAVLLGAAQCVREVVRDYDLVGRLGGEEFLVVLPEVPPEDGALIAERLRSDIREMRVATNDGPVRVTISVGVASARGGDIDHQALLLAADTAMYAAKEAGRDRVAVAKRHLPAA